MLPGLLFGTARLKLLRAMTTFAGTGWHFFAATFDDTNDLFSFYIDGELADSETVTSFAGFGPTQ